MERTAHTCVPTIYYTLYSAVPIAVKTIIFK